MIDITTSLSLQIGIVGAIHSIFLILSGICSFFWAFFESRSSPKKLLIIALIIYSGSIFPICFSGNLIRFIIFRVIAAIGFGALLPLTSTLVMDLYPTERKTKPLALLSTSTFIGFGAGNVVAGLLLGDVSWQGILFILSITCLISIILFSCSRIPNLRSSKITVEDQSYTFSLQKTSLNTLIKTRSNLFLIGFFFIYDFVIGTTSFYLIPLLRTDYSFTPFSSMVIQTLTYLPLLIGIPYWGKKADKKSLKVQGGKVKLLLSMVSIGPIASITAYLFGHIQIGIFIVGLMGFTFIISSATSIAYSILGDINPPELRPTVFSFGNLSAILGRSIGIALCGILYNIISLNYSFIFLIWQVLFLVGIPLILIIPRKRLSIEIEKISRTKEILPKMESSISFDEEMMVSRKIDDIVDVILNNQMRTMKTLRKLAKSQYFLSKLMYYTLEVVKRTTQRINKMETDHGNIFAQEGEDQDIYFKAIEELKAHLE
ncbi:MAG: MFS transporter [Promethearchaeota archaeon]